MPNFLRTFIFRAQCFTFKHTLFAMVYFGVAFLNAAEIIQSTARTIFRTNPRPEDPVTFSEYVEWMLHGRLMHACRILGKSGNWCLKMHRASCEIFSRRMPDHAAVIFKDLPAPQPHRKI